MNFLISELETLFRFFLNDFLKAQFTEVDQENSLDVVGKNEEYWRYLEKFGDLKNRIIEYDPQTKDESQERALSVLKSFSIDLFRTFGNFGEEYL